MENSLRNLPKLVMSIDAASSCGDDPVTILVARHVVKMMVMLSVKTLVKRTD